MHVRADRMKTLLLGCGSRRERIIGPPGASAEFDDLTTLDLNPDHHPDVLWNLEDPDPLPFDDSSFDEIAAYEVLEHIGAQGDYKTFFRQFSDYWRVLKPGGHLCATVPMWNGLWAWGDPSHRRIINLGTLGFLDQSEYQRQVGVTPMSDFRFCYRADFTVIGTVDLDAKSFGFVLQAIKPSRFQ